ncbi:metallophosphoesterase [Pelomonas cellulosilytica]|uniref:Metallophosphoesterase n=1 Tax=Pelomonas cellulosilytica TaxID=2906762 RepID=A0ABS8XSP7_9BURK|nr:metallophosphoesterase [Pelomonas sp. P8]MCE4555746.1 metallophosphoesterase [Pelomonas sp. P8]
MKIQLLSDLHLETESYQPVPAPDAELLILAGDIDATWLSLELFRGWPVPVLFVPGNHEFDRRDVDDAREALRRHVQGLGLRMLDDEAVVMPDAQGRRVRFVGCTRWCDFDAFGPAGRERAMRAGGYFQKVMQSTRDGEDFGVDAVRALALDSRAWLAGELSRQGEWDATVVVTHFAPSLKSADPRYGRQPGTASFCNDDEALLPFAQLWIHGHVHCRHDYRLGDTRVVSNARGHSRRGEADGFNGQRVLEVFPA